MKVKWIYDLKRWGEHGRCYLSTHCYPNLLVPLAPPNTTLTTYWAHSGSSKNTHKIVSYPYRLLGIMRYHLLFKIIQHLFIPEILICPSAWNVFLQISWVWLLLIIPASAQMSPLQGSLPWPSPLHKSSSIPSPYVELSSYTSSLSEINSCICFSIYVCSDPTLPTHTIMLAL